MEGLRHLAGMIAGASAGRGGPLPRSRWDGADDPGAAELGRRLTVLRRAWPALAADGVVGPLLTGPFQPVPWATLWDLWLPLAMELDHLHVQSRSKPQAKPHVKPFVQGILGLQGTGKTTLGAALTVLLTAAGRSVLSWSIDDLYLPYADRVALRSRDRQLIWRGPPGTHDVDLGLRVFQGLADRAFPLALPRFDKSCHGGQGDRAASEWITQPVDIVLFEGWFVGAQPIAPERFDQAPAPIVTEDDRAFARRCNERLRAYQPLWDHCDRLLVLQPIDYRASKRWRLEAERQRRASGAEAMADGEVAAFVDYFWTALHPDLFVTPLAIAPTAPTASPPVHAIVSVGPDRHIASLRRYPVSGDRPAN